MARERIDSPDPQVLFRSQVLQGLPREETWPPPPDTYPLRLLSRDTRCTTCQMAILLSKYVAYLSDFRTALNQRLFQAGNVLFRFNLSVLHSKSLVLQSILPNTQPSHLPKFDDTHPLQLLETSATDFERLLQVLLPL